MFFHKKNFCKDNQASVAIEFAIIVTFMILLFAGTYEIANYILIRSKLTRTVGVIGDLIARQNLSRTTLISYLQGAQSTLLRYNFNANGSIVASQIQNNNATTSAANMIISWQQNVNGAISQLGVVGAYPANLPLSFSVTGTQTVIVTEIFYNYQSLIFANFIPSKVLYASSYFVPRSGTMNSLIGG